ncbi:MAG: DUF3795 domain-containing protein [Candidatus Bathyarchaeota archaeon]|nr:DUF3795 domain-containing protein [Candidatus Bathyarchaeota archaeon]
MDNKKLTSYCGLYCLDCIPSNKRLFDTLRAFEEQLNRAGFEKYAQLKSGSNAVFKKYPQFKEVLGAIENLECKAPCRQGGGYADCKIRLCAQSKSYEGCWECSGYRNCDLLVPIKRVHPLLDYNLDLIKREGVCDWSKKRGKHYSWSKNL